MECGYTLLAELQEDILRIADSAHVPVIWATQVLESLVKKGTPTRAEITDAAMASRAECVMLNKGKKCTEVTYRAIYKQGCTNTGRYSPENAEPDYNKSEAPQNRGFLLSL